MLGPVALFHRIPVAFVAAAKAALLLENPFWFCEFAGRQERRGGFRLEVEIDSETRRDDLRRYADVELARVPAVVRPPGEHQIHMRAIGSLVLGKTDVAIDSAEIRPSAAGNVEIGMEPESDGRKDVEQRAKRLDHGGAIEVAMRVHPLFAIVASEKLEESNGIGREDRARLYSQFGHARLQSL